MRYELHKYGWVLGMPYDYIELESDNMSTLLKYLKPNNTYIVDKSNNEVIDTEAITLKYA